MGGALGKDVLQLLPGGGVLNGVVLHKNKMFGAVQCLLLCLQRGAGVAVEGHIGVVIGRVACPRLQVVGVVARGAVGVGQRPALGQQGRMVAAQQRKVAVEPLAHDADRAGAAEQQVDRQPEHREQQDQDDPRYFIRRVDMQPVYAQRDQEGQHRGADLNGGRVVVQLDGQPADPRDLQDDADTGKQHPVDAVRDGFAFFFGSVHDVSLFCESSVPFPSQQYSTPPEKIP